MFSHNGLNGLLFRENKKNKGSKGKGMSCAAVHPANFNADVMRAVSFLFYYSKLLLSVLLGIHRTAHPLSVKWRWNFWQSKYTGRRGRRYSK